MSLAFNFPQPLAERYRPKRIADFIGIHKPKTVLQAFAARPYSSAWLFLGYPGIGKTTIAMALAEEIGAEFHHIPSRKCDMSAVDEVVRRCHYIPLTGGMHLVLVDEADLMTPAGQDSFLSKLDATAAPPNTIFIFTANSVSNLHERFISRCRVLTFEQDSLVAELPIYLRKIYKRECSRRLEDADTIAKNSGYNVRDALSTLEVEIMSVPPRRRATR